MWLIGLDFGSTTTSILVAQARVLRNCVTGRMEWGESSVVYRPEPVYTPYRGDDLDEAALAVQLDRWLGESRVDRSIYKPDAQASASLPLTHSLALRACIDAQIASGGAIVTGLAARAGNAAVVARLVRARLGQAVIATADDPCLESWLAFMGNCLALSRGRPEFTVINLDIGGGTTNFAWGQAGEVRQVGCYFIGARHVQCVPGSYRIVRLSCFATRLFHDLGIQRQAGDDLPPEELDRVLDFYTSTLEAVVSGNSTILEHELVRFHEQVPFVPPFVERNSFRSGDTDTNGMNSVLRPILQFSGGVGELVYRLARGEALAGTTAYGDLGIDLARRIVQSPLLSRDLTSHIPETLGRATVYGLTIHNVELSGASLFLPHPEQLPLADLPIIGNLEWAPGAGDAMPKAALEQLPSLLEFAKRTTSGAALRIEVAPIDARTIKLLGERLAQALLDAQFPPDRPLLLLVATNIGKTLGQYATRWGQLPINLIVVDEIPSRHAHFVSLGRMVNQLVPVSFYGMHVG